MTTPPQFDHDFFLPDAGSAPVFVVGYPRSGTTLLQLMLDGAEGLAMLHETWFMTRVWQRRWGLPIVDGWEPFGVRMIDDWIGLLLRDGFEFDPVAYRDEVLSGPADLGRILSVLGAQTVTARGAVRWGEKTPLHVYIMGELARMFPRAQFVHIVRDGRDVAASTSTKSFTRIDDPLGAIIDWRRTVETGLAAARTPDLAGRVTLVRYEDLVSAPENALGVLCNALGLTASEDMLNFQARAATGASDVPWMSRLKEGLSGTAIERWRGDLAGEDQALATALAAPALGALGYQIEDSDLDPKAVQTADRLWQAFDVARADQRARRDDHVAMHRGWYRDLLNNWCPPR